MQDVAAQVSQFVDLQLWQVIYLVFVGFVGGLVSGFIGSGGAFVLTPSMMSMGGFRVLSPLLQTCAISSPKPSSGQ